MKSTKSQCKQYILNEEIYFRLCNEAKKNTMQIFPEKNSGKKIAEKRMAYLLHACHLVHVRYTTVSYDEIKQKVITQANDYHRVKAYTP